MRMTRLLRRNVSHDLDIAKLKEFYSDSEIIELVFSIALFNAVNRWTDGMGLPQERHISDEGEIERRELRPRPAGQRVLVEFPDHADLLRG